MRKKPTIYIYKIDFLREKHQPLIVVSSATKALLERRWEKVFRPIALVKVTILDETDSWVEADDIKNKMTEKYNAYKSIYYS